jgi:hypothetical protein
MPFRKNTAQGLSSMTRPCPIDINRPNKPIYSGHLRLGGSNRQGDTISLTNYYLTWNGRPFFVVSGEFHYSRYPEAYWEEELLKIKAGGVNTVATYIFWIFHEEKQGIFEWEGPKNLRRFIELCARHDLKVLLRIGPFVHGEWRNGGLPDWLYGQPFEVRSNDPGYLACVERYYGELGQQVHSLLFKEGGPIIGIQIENEYMHASAPWEVVDPVRDVEWIPAGREGAAHLETLKDLAHKAGLDVPIYLVTAWGSPIVEDETLPVYGRYAYPTWVDALQPSPYYTFQDGHTRPVEHPTHRVPCYYPLAYAEMQGGMQVRYHNRPAVPPESTEAMALVGIGSGSNWLGYYMYHGGTTPVGGHGFSHERLHPQLSYDYQAPVGEFGELRTSYRYLKLLHLFTQAYGESLCRMGTILPDNAGNIKPEDMGTVRYCVRARDGAGFLFVNNFQDHVEMRDQEGVVFEVNTPNGLLRIPETGGFSIKCDACFILPINQMLCDARLVYATAQPLTVLKYHDISHYFYFVPDGLDAEFSFQGDTLKRVSGDLVQHSAPGRIYIKPGVGQEYLVDIETALGEKVKVTTLTRHEAEHTWQGAAWGAERVIVSAADLMFVDGQVEARATGASDMILTVWPVVDHLLAAEGTRLEQTADRIRTMLRVIVPAKYVNVQVEQISARKYQLTLPGDALAGLSDLFLKVDYEGDTGMAFINGRLVADNFNSGTPWVIGLKRFAPKVLEKGLCLVFHPLRQGVVKNVSSQFAGRFEFEGQEKLVVHSISVIPEYSTRLV